MNKRGNTLVALGFLFVLFLLFLVLKSFGFSGITGYTSHEFGNGTNFTVLDIDFAKLNVTNSTSFTIISDDEFYRYDNIGCIVDYNITGSGSNVSVGFYSEDNNVGDPNNIFYNRVRPIFLGGGDR